MAWETIQTRVGEKPAIVLVDRRFATQAPVAELTRLCWVGIWCATSPGDHLWNPAEAAILDAIEDDLLILADQFGHGWAAYVLRICTRGIREFYFYAGTDADLARIPDHLRTRHPRYRIEFAEKVDASWDWYRSYLTIEH